MSVLRILLWPFRRQAKLPPAVAASAPGTADEPEGGPILIRYPGGDIVFATPNYLTRWRAKTLFTKEPETIEWIAGFNPGEVLIDVGANVGLYTIWAAKTRAVKVFAFEPESQNYAILYKNIVLNDLSEQVVAYCAALSDESRFSLLHLSEFKTGGSIHTFGEDLDYKLEPRLSEIRQGCISTTLDYLVAAGIVPVPHHIKIDVDGLEHKVFAGCRTVLKNPVVKSMLVEVNTNLDQHRKLIMDLNDLGFTYSERQVAQASCTEGKFTGVGNYVFRR